jgi:hypothetical protein
MEVGFSGVVASALWCVECVHIRGGRLAGQACGRTGTDADRWVASFEWFVVAGGQCEQQRQCVGLCGKENTGTSGIKAEWSGAARVAGTSKQQFGLGEDINYSD